MKVLLTFAELAELPSGTKVARIQDGQIESFYIAGVIQLKQKVLSLISGIDFKKTIAIHESNPVCGKNLTWISGYDSKQVGEIMIAQLEWQIKGIKETYLNSI